MKKIVFKPDWDYHTIKVPEDVERAVRADNGLLYGGEPDLKRFFGRGGKLLMYHGWADPLVSPTPSLIMYKRIIDAVGPSASNSLALFMVPGDGSLSGWTRHGRFRQSCRDRSMGRVGRQAAVDCRVAQRLRSRGSDAAALCVSRDRALHRHRQHGRSAEFPLPDAVGFVMLRSCSR
jgi:hypothetical protein